MLCHNILVSNAPLAKPHPSLATVATSVGLSMLVLQFPIMKNKFTIEIFSKFLETLGQFFHL